MENIHIIFVKIKILSNPSLRLFITQYTNVIFFNFDITTSDVQKMDVLREELYFLHFSIFFHKKIYACTSNYVFFENHENHEICRNPSRHNPFNSSKNEEFSFAHE